EFLLEKLYTSLRAMGINLEDKIAKNQGWKEVSQKWAQEGMVEIHNGHLSLTSKGYLLLDSLMNDLFIRKLE
ncbi:MAG: hypothetical protein H7336_17210, partial [Bacteriovorax sp.]|nr:hypothetical protein [Bacteriovorax sp.]